MCGIIGYVGPRECRELLLSGLERLEYRGYDSAGLSLVTNGSIDSVHAVGNLSFLHEAVSERANGAGELQGSTGIGHTRWATHGKVTTENAHPHSDTSGRVHIALNGIVENWAGLRERLLAAGAEFTSETDAEVVAHLVADHFKGDLTEAVRSAYNELRGHYAFVAMSADQPDVLVGARKECPLVVGLGEGESFIASAIPAFMAETRRVQLVEDGEIVEISPAGARFVDAAGTAVEREVSEVDWDVEAAEKGGFETFMLKEIHEQGDAVAETVADRLVDGGVELGDIGISDEELKDVRRIVVVACGTSYHAGLVGRYAIEWWSRVPVEMDIASEFRYRNPVIDERDLVVGISQSGETADTLAAMRLARERGAKVLAITNIMGSQATRDADGVLFTRAGLEIGVAATKTFVAQVAAMYLLALKLAQLHDKLEPEVMSALSPGAARAAAPGHAARGRGRRAGEDDRRALEGRGLLPLPRAPRGALGVPRGRAEAQGGLLHPHGRLRGGRDEARADRAARRAHTGGLRGHGLACAREGALEHVGGRRSGRSRDRGGHGGLDRGGRIRRGGRLRAAHGLAAAADPGDRAAAAARVPHRPRAGPQCRPAPKPGQDRHGGIRKRMSLPDWLDPLFQADEMRAVDSWAIEEQGVPSLDLMERAGAGLARLTAASARPGPARVVVGKGNNGGDGLVVARLLREEGREVDVLAASPLDDLGGDARENLERLPGAAPEPFEPGRLEGSGVVVDALLGTGFEGEPREPVAGAIAAINDQDAPVVACDIPSGVNASTGEIEGMAVRAHATATFHGPKLGLYVAPGAIHAGKVEVVEIGIPRGAPGGEGAGLISERVLELFPPRPREGSKFSSGTVVVVGGSMGLTGAPAMAAMSAQRTGAGYVQVAVPGPVQPAIDLRLLEQMSRGLPDDDGAHTPQGVADVEEMAERAGAVVLGPGIGRSEGALEFARRVARAVNVPLLIDADGLNAHAERLESLQERRAPTILTPHAGELGRLLGRDSEDVGRHRLAYAREAAERSGAIVLLKGDDTIVAAPGGAAAVSPGGTPALATAGTGDVLSGLIGALLAKRVGAFEAAALGTLAHVRAGLAAAERHGADHVIAGDVIDALPSGLSR